MAEYQTKNPENIPGRFYVDETCIDCDQCRSIAPAFYRRVDEATYTVVWRQPVTPEEIDLALEAMDCCPTESIGSDGDSSPS